MAGVPIRLLRKDGQIINLNCTDYQVNITRSLITVPVPITAERFGADLNMVQAEIIMECILVDDDCTTVDFGLSYSGATIDFSYRRPKEDDDNTAHTAWIENGITAADLDDAVFTFISTDETKFTVTLKNGSATTSDNDMQVNISSVTTAAGMVTAIKAVLDAHSVFLSKFTVTAGAGANANLSGNTKLDFAQKGGGSSGATDTPTFVAENVDYDPHIIVFSNEEDTGCRSAGDKIQNILATVANNSVLGGMGKIGQFGSFGGVGGSMGDKFMFGQSKKSDYIIGLQLPYNSLAQSSLANVGDPVAGYNVRNFLLVTGGAMATNLKDASGNEKDASTPFIFTDKHTGISGTVKTASIKYDAGETIYRATLTFQPLDLVVGVG